MIMELGVLRGLITAMVFIFFVLLTAWAYSRGRKSEFDVAAQMPLQDDPKPPTGEST
ncbi:MAG: CcoQ/FixQ family Cbb3-type cytochrome c oxidase assembly chaperone [Pseudomonadota bacterium]